MGGHRTKPMPPIFNIYLNNNAFSKIIEFSYFFSIEFSNTNPETIKSANIVNIVVVVIFLPFLYFKLNNRLSPHGVDAISLIHMAGRVLVFCYPSYNLSLYKPNHIEYCMVCSGQICFCLLSMQR